MVSVHPALRGAYLTVLSLLASSSTFAKAVVAQKVKEKPKVSTIPFSGNPALTLLAMGSKFEEDHQFENALQCYKTAQLMGEKDAERFMKALLLKLKQAGNEQQNAERNQALARSADQGNAEDAFRLANIFLDEKKTEEAVERFKQAIQNKSAEAAYVLAKMYETGDRVPKNFAEAEKCYELGAQNGHAECAYMWAKLLELKARDAASPQEKDQLSKETLRWMKEAADRGHAKAAFEVAQAMAFVGQLGMALTYIEKAQKTAAQGTSITMDLKTLMNFCSVLTRMGGGPLMMSAAAGVAMTIATAQPSSPMRASTPSVPVVPTAAVH